MARARCQHEELLPFKDGTKICADCGFVFEWWDDVPDRRKAGNG